MSLHHELAATWLSGNRKDVIAEITSAKSRAQAAALALKVATYLRTGDERAVLLRLLESYEPVRKGAKTL